MKERSMKEGKEIKSLFDKEFDYLIRMIGFIEDDSGLNDTMIIEIFRSNDPNMKDYSDDPNLTILKSKSGSGNINHMIDNLKDFLQDSLSNFNLDIELNLKEFKSKINIWNLLFEIHDRFDKSFPDLFDEIIIDEIYPY